MIVPSQRLLWIAALAGVPLAVGAGFEPRAAIPCLAALAAGAAVIMLDAALADRRAAGLQLQTAASLRLSKNAAATFPITIDNRSARTIALRVAAVMPEGMESPKLIEDVIAPAGQSIVEWPCAGVERGDHTLRELHIETPSPLGLWHARARRTAACEFRVYPSLRDQATASLFLKNDPGVRLRRVVGKGREFDNLRQYLPGDNFEDIYWKATARRGVPVVKLYRVEHAQEVYAIVDASRLSAREGILEGYVDAALHLALAAERQGDRFGLVTFSSHIHRLVRARHGMDHFRLCRDTIYNLHPERVSPDFREVFAGLQLALRRRSLLVFFTSLDDALLAETFEREIGFLARRHLVLVNVTRTAGMMPLFTGEPPQSLDAVYEGLAGQMLWNRMRALTLALANRGVRLTVVEPGRIKQQAAAGYFDVKRRQVL
jgi:uncharacterized protein (DUF58 family)